VHELDMLCPHHAADTVDNIEQCMMISAIVLHCKLAQKVALDDFISYAGQKLRILDELVETHPSINN
jgi:hypothetical protein